MFFAVIKSSRYFIQLIKAESMIEAGIIARKLYGTRYDTMFKDQTLARNYCIGGNAN